MNLMSKDISDDFPISNKIYLNNASVSLMPLQSINAMNDFLISYNSLGPDSKDSALLIEEKLDNVRKIIAKIICCSPKEVILTQSTTDGINIVANGLSFDNNSNIVIRGMTHEHHSNFYPWIKLKNKILNETELVVSIEASETDYWKKYTGINGLNFGINDFGKSAAYKSLINVS